jgi:hypothetical protein
MSKQALAVKEDAPLLLRRIQKVPDVCQVIPIHRDKVVEPAMSHFSVVTTGGQVPEMHDQMEDPFR